MSNQPSAPQGAGNAKRIRDIDEITPIDVRGNINDLFSGSKIVREAAESGKLAIVGANDKLVLGDIHPLVMVGQVS